MTQIRKAVQKWWKLLTITAKVARLIKRRYGRGFVFQYTQMILFAIFYKIIPYEYFELRLYETTWQSYRKRPTAVGKRQLDDIITQTTYRDFAPALKNKYIFHYHMNGLGLPVPKLLGLYHGSQGIATSGHPLRTEKDIEHLIEETCTSTGLVFKPASGHAGGEGVHVFPNWEKVPSGIRFVRFSGEEAMLPDLVRDLGKEAYLLQEYVPPAGSLLPLATFGVPTVRVITFKAADNTVGILGATVKVPRRRNARSGTDNGGQGGLLLRVCLDDGVFCEGWHEVDLPGDLTFGETVDTHPDTGYSWAGNRLEEWPAIRALATRAAALVPHTCIGWDIAVSSQGPVIIEGNADTGVRLCQDFENWFSGAFPQLLRTYDIEI